MWTIRASEELSAFITYSSSTQLMASIFQMGEKKLTEVSVTEQILEKLPNSGELNMCKHCVPGSLFSAHTWDKANY